MRLRRLEFVIIGLTLAFVCFMGGFFTGRSWSAVNITPVATLSENSGDNGVSITVPETPLPTGGDNQLPALPADVQSPSENQPAKEDSPEVGTPTGGDGRININLASQTELTDLPGIGNVLASRIIDYRRQHGDFGAVEDIRNVSGIGDKRYEAIQDKITVGN